MSNELSLSTDIHIITAEINSYKQVAGQAIFEIGKRLKHAKENDLVHGQFGEWVESLGFNSSHAHKFIKAYDEFKNSQSVANLGVAKIFQLISMPESVDRQEFIQQTHTVPSTGEAKSVDDMTVRELREVKAELKRKEDELNGERKAKQALLDTVEAMQTQSQKVKTVTQTIEVTPNSIKKEIENLKADLSKEKNDKSTLNNKLLRLSEEKLEAEEKLSKAEEYLRSEDREIEKLRKEKEKLELEAHISISSLQIGIHRFVEEYSPSVFLQGAVAASTFMMRDDLLDSVIALEEFAKKLREMLYSKIEVNPKNIIELN